MAGYIGSKASVVSSGAERKKTFAITTNTTSLTGLSYTVGQVHVFHNGVRLVDGTDYTATNGTSITLTSAAENGDEVVVISYATFQTSDTVSASAGGTFSNAVTIDADGATALTVDRATSDGTIIDVQKGGTTVGSIGVESNNLTVDNIYHATKSGLVFAGSNVSPRQNGANADNAVNLGASTVRWKDLYLSGGVYLGGTGAANKLDDYEEGTWTPAITSGGLSVSTNYSSTYTKVGSLVHVRTYFTVSGTGTSAIFNIGGLPFTSIGNGYSPNIIDIGKGGKAGAYCRVGTNTTELEVLYSGDSPTAPRVNMAGNQIANDGPYIILQATYHTNA